MEGLTGVSYAHGVAGGSRVTLDYVNPPGSLLEAAEWAMLNDIPFYWDSSGQSMKVINIDVRNEDDHIDATVYGSPKRRYLVKRRRIVQVDGWLRP